MLYSRIGAGHWLQALSGYASTNIVAAAGVTLTRNGSNVVSVTVTDPFLVLTNDDIIVSGCANASFNGLFVTTSNDGSTLKWTNTGSAGTTTCSNAIEIQSQLNGLSVREAQLFPAVEIVNTVDPVTFANNFNLTVEPNTNFQVTAGDQLEDQVYSEVGQGLDHNLISFRSQISPSIADIIHNDTLFDQIPEGTTWYNISFEDAPNQYLGLGGTKPILNTLFEMEHSATPFNFIFHGFPTPLTALFTFNGCLFSCTDVRSKFDLFEIPINGGTYTQTIHQDTGLLDRTTANSTQRLTVQESPVGFSWSGIGTGASNNFFAVPSDTRSTIGGGAGTSSVIDQISSIIETTINGTGGASSHVIQTVAGWSVDVPATFVGLANGCATFASGVLGSTGVACGSGSAGVASINGTAGAFTFTGSGVSCTTTTCSFSGTGSGIGSITWALPSFLSASPTTISATGTQTFSLVTQSANTVFAGPASGSAAAPTFRSLVSLDIPNNGANTTGNAATATLATNSSAVGGVALSGLCQTGGTGCPTSGTGISGQTAGWAIEAATATTATGPFPMDDGITTTGFVTIHKNVQIVGTGTANGWLLPEGTAITGVALSAAFYPSSTTHRWMQNPNNIGALMIPGETAAITPGHLWAAAANGIDMVDGGTAGGGSSAGPLGTVQVAGASGAFAQGTGDANYQSVASTPLSGSQGGLQVIANSVVDQMAQFFTSDGTPYWCAGLGYCSLGVFAEDYTYSLIQNPSKFPTEINGVAGTSTIRNIVSKFIAQVDVHGQIPAAINSAGTGASVTYSGWDNNHAFYSGVAMYMIPLDCYVDWQKTGSTSCYTTYVNAIKTAQAYSPINGTSHLPTNVVGANEWMPQSLFLEEERSSGDVANASVLRAASDAVMSQMATAAGDSTNATFFSTDFTNVTTSIQSEFIDPTSHMLWAGTGQNKQIDMLTSGMAVWLSRFTGQNILTLAQQKAIGTFLHTNLATINYNGFFANTVTTGGAVTTWTTKGIIPSGGGGSGYTSDGCAAGVYQQGYWSLVTGMNAYALSLTNPTDVPTLLASFRDAASGGSGDPAWEYYDQAHGHSAAGCTPAFSSTATTPNLESPQGAAWVAANIVGPTAVAATLGTTDKYGAIVTGTASGAGSYINLCSVVTLSAGASCSGGVISITTGTTSFTISAIPGTFVNLILDINEYSTSGSAANLLVQFNGDAGANYNYQQTHSGSSTVSGFGNTSLTSAPIAAVGSNSAGGSAFTITLPFYAKTVNKFINSVGGQYAGTPPVSADTYIGSWNSTAAITSITFSLSGGNFGTGFMSIHATN